MLYIGSFGAAAPRTRVPLVQSCKSEIFRGRKVWSGG